MLADLRVSIKACTHARRDLACRTDRLRQAVQLTRMSSLLRRFAWWCNQAASALLVSVYTCLFTSFGWTKVVFDLHFVMAMWLACRCFCPSAVEREIIAMFELFASNRSGLKRWCFSHMWVFHRDGILIVTANIAVVLLKNALDRRMERADSTLARPLAESLPSLRTRSSNCRRRRRRRRRSQRKFRCVLTRLVVCRLVHNSRRRRPQPRSSRLHLHHFSRLQ